MPVVTAVLVAWVGTLLCYSISEKMSADAEAARELKKES